MVSLPAIEGVTRVVVSDLRHLHQEVYQTNTVACLPNSLLHPPANESMTVDKELPDFYERPYGQPLAEPRDEDYVKNILSCVRAQHGSLDSDEEEKLYLISLILQKKMSLIARNSRKVATRFTKA